MKKRKPRRISMLARVLRSRELRTAGGARLKVRCGRRGVNCCASPTTRWRGPGFADLGEGRFCYKSIKRFCHFFSKEIVCV